MNAQNIIVGLIIFAALVYVGRTVLHKIKSFSAKSGACANDCGCGDSKSTVKTSFVSINKS